MIPATVRTVLPLSTHGKPRRNIGSTPARRRRFAVAVPGQNVPYLVPPSSYLSRDRAAPFLRPCPIPQPADLTPYRVVVGYARTLADARDLAAVARSQILTRARFYDPARNADRPQSEVGTAEHATVLLGLAHDSWDPIILETSERTTYPRTWTPGTLPPILDVGDVLDARVSRWADLLPHVARTLYLLDYADAVDPGDRETAPRLSGPCAGPGSDWDHVAPAGWSLSAHRAAVRVLRALRNHKLAGPRILADLKSQDTTRADVARMGQDIAHVAAGSGGDSGYYVGIDVADHHGAIPDVETFGLAEDDYHVAGIGPIPGQPHDLPQIIDRPETVRPAVGR